MYSQHVIHLHRSPDEIGSNGGGEAGAGEAGAGAGGAGAQPEYLTKADFQAFQQEITQSLSRRSEPAAQPDKSSQPHAPREPNPADYDFKKPADLARYNRDNHRWNSHLDEQERAPIKAKEEADRKLQETVRGHSQRLADYTKENPTAAAEIKAAKIPGVTDPVKEAVFSSRNSHLAIHYLAKHPEEANELNLLADVEGKEAVRERVGEMVALMKAEQKQAESVTVAAGQRPPRMNLKGGMTAATKVPTKAELFERFHAS